MLNPDKEIIVSVLLAARNEESNIERCLNSLQQLDFPADNVEILIGDDDSEDRTAELICKFISNKQQFRYIKINQTVAGLRGKANVLAQLARQAKGKYFFYCDADIAVTSTWIRTMLGHFKEQTGVVVGVTRMKNSHLFAKFLSLEWLFILGSIRLASLYKIPITGLGNNMAVTREAYFSFGGYEKIGFSIVEDYTLFMAIVGKGYDFQMAYNAKILTASEPVHSLSELIKQRKRWMQGVMQSFWATKLTIIVSASIIPVLLLLSIWHPTTAYILIALHYLAVTASAVLAVSILRQRDLWNVVPWFWFYMFGISLLMLINYFLPGKTVWKGREY